MSRLWNSVFSLAALGLAAIVSQDAKADYLYTFSSEFGTLQIETVSIIQNFAFSPSVTFTMGSGTLSNTVDNQFSFEDGQTSTGLDYDSYNFAFFPFPTSVGDYSTAGSGITRFFPTGEDGIDTVGTLSIAVAGAVPELPTWTLAAVGFLALGAIGQSARRKRMIQPA